MQGAPPKQLLRARRTRQRRNFGLDLDLDHLDDAEEERKLEGNQKPESKEEIGGPKGPEPTRYNDWEKNGRVSDF